MWFKKKTPLNSDEYESLIKKIVGIVGDIDAMRNRLGIATADITKLKTRLTLLEKENLAGQAEDLKNEDVKYL